jgi:hypothetical protein
VLVLVVVEVPVGERVLEEEWNHILHLLKVVQE